jgi:hypothetical protein
MTSTAPHLIWRAFGSLPPAGKTGSKYKFEPCDGCCATCAALVTEGVPFAPRRGVAGIDNDTFSGHGEYARYGSHVCPACAWLYGEPKTMHRAMLVVGNEGWWPTIAQVIPNRPRWRNALSAIARADPATPMTGILTTDPKPRLWPRAQMATCGAPGLYVHVPEQDLSGWHAIDLTHVAKSLAAVDRAVAAGFTKTAALRGLMTSPAMVDKAGIELTERLEQQLSPLRGRVEFGVAAVIA